MNQPLKTTDTKSKKHIPVIDVTRIDDLFQVSISIGNGKGHENTNTHHISWVKVYFQPDGERFPFIIGRFDFSAHGITDNGVNSGIAYTDPKVACFLRTGKRGKILVTSYCNVHGPWSDTAELSD